MKKLTLLLVLCGLAAFGQQPRQLTLTSNTIVALGTYTPGNVIALDNSADLALQVTLALSAAVGVNSNITVTLQSSLDRVNWANWRQFTLTTSGTSLVTVATNYEVGALPFVRVGTLVSANTQSVAGLDIWHSLKRIR